MTNHEYDSFPEYINRLLINHYNNSDWLTATNNLLSSGLKNPVGHLAGRLSRHYEAHRPAGAQLDPMVDDLLTLTESMISWSSVALALVRISADKNYRETLSIAEKRKAPHT